MKIKKIILLLIFSILSNIVIAQDFWQPLNGPIGVDLNAFGIDASDNYYITIDGNKRIFRSTDRGQNWEVFEEGIIDNSIFSTWSNFILSPDSSLFLVDYNVLYVLRPQSDIWEKIESGVNEIYDLSINPKGEIFIISEDGIFKSSNQGNDFQQIIQKKWTNGKISTYGKDKNFILDNGKDIYSFNDDGSNLKQINNPDSDLYTYTPPLYDHISDKLFFVGTFYFWVSNDMGLTWDVINVGDGEWIYYVKIHKDKIYAYSENRLLFLSDDGGNSWTQKLDYSKYDRSGIKSLKFTKDNKILIQTYSKNWYTKYPLASFDMNSTSLEEVTFNIKQAPHYSIKKNKNGLMYVNIRYSKHYLSFDDLVTWKEITLNDDSKFLIRVLLTEENILYAIDSDYKIQKSEDLGVSWIDITPNLEPNDKIYTLEMNHKEELYAKSENNYFFKSSDKGATWEEKGIADIESYFINGNLYFDHFGKIYWFYSNKWAVSNDDGETWNTCFDKHKIDKMQITSDGTVFVGGIVYDSTGWGDSGTFILKDNKFTKFLNHNFTSICKNKAGEIFVSYYNFIFSDKDSSRTYYSTPFTNPKYTNIVLDSDQYLYALSPYNIMYKSSSPTIEKHFVLGYVFLDENENCLLDSTEGKLENLELHLRGDTSLIATTDINGKYSFNVPDGKYELSLTLPDDLNGESCVNNLHLNLDSNKFDSTIIIFPVEAQPICPKLNIKASIDAIRRCEYNSYNISYQNIGQDSSINNKVIVEFDSILIFKEASIPYSAKYEKAIEFKIEDLDINESGQFELKFYLPCDAELGKEHCLISHIISEYCDNGEIASDSFCLSNIDQRITTEKSAFVDGNKITEFVEQNKKITYHIEFINTGFDSITNIKIIDPISEFLDINTLKVVQASHPNEWSIINDTILEVYFENILLPDSATNYSGSSGFVDFSIMQDKDLPIKVLIKNQGQIEFSSHYPNKETNLLAISVREPVCTKDVSNSCKISVLPQPFSTKAKIILNDVNLSELVSFEVYNSLGNKVHSEIIKSTEFYFYRKQLPRGLYFFTIRCKNQLFKIKKILIQ